MSNDSEDVPQFEPHNPTYGINFHFLPGDASKEAVHIDLRYIDDRDRDPDRKPYFTLNIDIRTLKPLKGAEHIDTWTTDWDYTIEIPERHARVMAAFMQFAISEGATFSER